jgi:hypothetical protein
VAYAAAHGLTPEAMLERTRGHQGAFMAWIGARWAEWFASQGRTYRPGFTSLSETDRAAFGVWLAEQSAQPACAGAPTPTEDADHVR